MYKSISKPVEDLVREISRLELEILYLEKYLLSLYRKNFAKSLSFALSSRAEERKPEASLESANEEYSGIFRTHSSLSHISACSFRASSPTFEALDTYHSLPLSMLERTNDGITNENRTVYNVRETPNWVSEEMIKCISTVYFHLSDMDNLPLDSWLDKELSGSFSATFEIHDLVRDSEKINSVQDMLHSYRSLISKLAQVNPGKLRHDERLAFWINVHNALVMHAYLVYGIPKGSLKRVSLVLKAAYNIGGHTISVDTIQSSILGCRLPRPNPWLHSLFFPKKRFKAGDPMNAFAVKSLEPRLHFALCSGCKSDPTVRMYTSKKVFQELEMAKEDYIQMNVKLHKDLNLLVPKKVEHFVKEIGGLAQSGIAQKVEHLLSDSMGIKNGRLGKLWKKVDWIPYDFAFVGSGPDGDGLVGQT
ncbi:hypothetical protein STAS_19013 [Striga asiatica]|uniref:DUF547 domain-containing protein n=1 Tax=Striga asiatica TaxID=4170 RepID=A0A5A7QB78_STRAF|nr:hypothetical protein STAS_19013 [Striga asiatica]